MNCRWPIIHETSESGQRVRCASRGSSRAKSNVNCPPKGHTGYMLAKKANQPGMPREGRVCGLALCPTSASRAYHESRKRSCKTGRQSQMWFVLGLMADGCCDGAASLSNLDLNRCPRKRGVRMRIAVNSSNTAFGVANAGARQETVLHWAIIGYIELGPSKGQQYQQLHSGGHLHAWLSIAGRIVRSADEQWAHSRARGHPFLSRRPRDIGAKHRQRRAPSGPTSTLGWS